MDTYTVTFITIVIGLILWVFIYVKAKENAERREKEDQENSWKEFTGKSTETFKGKTFCVIARKKDGRQTDDESLLIKSFLEAGAKIKAISRDEAQQVWKSLGCISTNAPDFIFVGTTSEELYGALNVEHYYNYTIDFRLMDGSGTTIIDSGVIESVNRIALLRQIVTLVHTKVESLG